MEEITTEILAPVVTLVTWTMVMWTWMYATRLPAMKKAGIQSDPTAPRGQQMNLLPSKVRWKADNYNNLMEQPTVFYAIALTLALLGAGSGVNLLLAWLYVGLRVLHSLVQVLINIIELRFAFFMLSSLVLVVMIVNTIILVFRDTGVY